MQKQKTFLQRDKSISKESALKIAEQFVEKEDVLQVDTYDCDYEIKHNWSKTYFRLVYNGHYDIYDIYQCCGRREWPVGYVITEGDLLGALRTIRQRW